MDAGRSQLSRATVSISSPDRARCFEIPNGEAYWADAAWGGPQNSEAGRFSYQTDWFKLGFGKIPPRTSAKAKVEGLKALKEQPSELKNPTVRVEQGSLTIEGTVKTGEYLEYVGRDDASVYDKNWNRLRQLPVRRREYVMPTGWHKLSVVSESSWARPWLSVRFITEGEPLVVRGSRSG